MTYNYINCNFTIDYIQHNTYWPISLLVTLSKMLEFLITQRLACIVEEYLLWSYNHFKNLKQKTTVDIFLILQEKIYQAWKDRKVLSLIVKRVINGINIDILLDRLRKRQILELMVIWLL